MTVTELLQSPAKDLLNIYFTAGYPHLDSLCELLPALEAAGADLVEIGIPYSDPLSDGPTIQQSSAHALANGISLELIFKQLEETTTQIPKVMMGYFNTVLQFGFERFCQRCADTGISGVILPDLPIELYLDRYASLFEQHGLSNIFLVTPETPADRLHYIDQHSTSFIYAVSSSSTTGVKAGIQDAAPYLKGLQTAKLKTPFLVGFNIASPKDFDFACQYARGGIIGSAFIRYLAKQNDLHAATTQFVQHIRQLQLS
ncbi:MAG: tryptophan synthase subunit alpha [Salibacteraceae bacterium]